MFLGVGQQARRRIVLRVDRDRHHVHLVRFSCELGLRLREDAGHHRADGSARREDEVEDDGPSVVERRAENDPAPALVDQRDRRHLIGQRALLAFRRRGSSHVRTVVVDVRRASCRGQAPHADAGEGGQAADKPTPVHGFTGPLHWKAPAFPWHVKGRAELRTRLDARRVRLRLRSSRVTCTSHPPGTNASCRALRGRGCGSGRHTCRACRTSPRPVSRTPAVRPPCLSSPSRSSAPGMPAGRVPAGR